MRKWYKFWLDPSQKGMVYISKCKSFEEHEKAMGGFKADEAYNSKRDFFDKYFFNYHLGRLECCDKFIKKHLRREDDILSIASGRCANELYLMEDGCKVTCSDLGRLGAYSETRRLFPKFEHIKLNIIEGPACKKYDTILSLGLIYIFDEQELFHFFKNVSDSLKDGGQLILDSAGSPDKPLSYLIHDVLLKYETIFKWILKSVLEQKSHGFVTKEFGYRRTDREIIESAQKFGLELTAQENYAFLTDFKRSQLLDIMIRSSPMMERLCSLIGRNIPYVRMYSFRKII